MKSKKKCPECDEVYRIIKCLLEGICPKCGNKFCVGMASGVWCNTCGGNRDNNFFYQVKKAIKYNSPIYKCKGTGKIKEKSDEQKE